MLPLRMDENSFLKLNQDALVHSGSHWHSFIDFLARIIISIIYACEIGIKIDENLVKDIITVLSKLISTIFFYFIQCIVSPFPDPALIFHNLSRLCRRD